MAESECKLLHVNQEDFHTIFNEYPELKRAEFPDNIILASTVATYLGVSPENVVKGIKKTKYDVGHLKIWEYKKQKNCFLINGFAANDPFSTKRVLQKSKEILPDTIEKYIGILNLRDDRGDRTRQWIQILKRGEFSLFENLYVYGAHAPVVKRKLQSKRNIEVITEKSPEGITKRVLENINYPVALFGFGNIGGKGKEIIDYWNKIGAEYEF